MDNNLSKMHEAANERGRVCEASCFFADKPALNRQQRPPRRSRVDPRDSHSRRACKSARVASRPN